MNIILSSDDTNGIQYVQEWLEFADIAFQRRSFWSSLHNSYQLDSNIYNSVVVANQGILRNASVDNTPKRLQELQQFCNQGNQLWIIGTDLTLDLTVDPTLTWLRQADLLPAAGNIVYLLDAQPLEQCYLHQLQRIKTVVMPVNQFMRGAPRCRASSLVKPESARYDFLLTTIRRPERPHREVLFQQLEKRPGLIERGIVSHSRKQNDASAWRGELPAQHDFWGFHASMDLYLDCYVELAPETCYRDLYYFTEKTQKPIMTKTPFLSVSTPGYLKWLRNQGFQTFEHLIDEGYDNCSSTEDRVAALVDTLEHIVKNGSRDFYLASESVLEHNFSHLCEIAGGWHHCFDSVFWKLLEDFSKLKNG